MKKSKSKSNLVARPLRPALGELQDKSILNFINSCTYNSPKQNLNSSTISPTISAANEWIKLAMKHKSKACSPKCVKTRPLGCKLRPRRPPQIVANDNLENSLQTTLTQHYKPRKSKRIIENSRADEKTQLLKKLEGEEDGLEIRVLEEKGRAVFATRLFMSNELVCEYSGELISSEEAKNREMSYSEDILKGCYMYYFKYQDKTYCIDATRESGRMGRLINHSRIDCNLRTKLINNGSRLHLCLFSKQDISPGQELLYDYGDRSKKSLSNFPWLKS